MLLILAAAAAHPGAAALLASATGLAGRLYCLRQGNSRACEGKEAPRPLGRPKSQPMPKSRSAVLAAFVADPTPARKAYDQRHLSPVAAAALAKDFPKLIHPKEGLHPRKVSAILRYTDMFALRHFLEMIPTEIVRSYLVYLLDHLSHREFKRVVAPIINTVSWHQTAADLLKSELLQPSLVAKIITNVPEENLFAVLALSPKKLVSLVKAFGPGQLEPLTMKWLRMPVAFVESRMVPVLSRLEHLKLAAGLVKEFEPPLLLEFLSEVDAKVIAAWFNVLETSDIDPDSSIVSILQHAEKQPDFLRKTLLPLMHHGDPSECLQLVRSVEVSRILPIMEELGSDSLISLLKCADLQLVRMILNSPLARSTHTMAQLAKGAACIAASRLGSGAIQVSSALLRSAVTCTRPACCAPPLLAICGRGTKSAGRTRSPCSRTSLLGPGGRGVAALGRGSYGGA